MKLSLLNFPPENYLTEVRDREYNRLHDVLKSIQDCFGKITEVQDGETLSGEVKHSVEEFLSSDPTGRASEIAIQNANYLLYYIEVESRKSEEKWFDEFASLHMQCIIWKYRVIYTLKRKNLTFNNETNKLEELAPISQNASNTDSFLNAVPSEQWIQYATVEKSVSERATRMAEKELGLAEGQYVFGMCHRIWAHEKRIFKEEYDIDWKSPAELHPDMCYD